MTETFMIKMIRKIRNDNFCKEVMLKKGRA